MITDKLMERLFPTKGLNPKKYNLVRERQALIDALNKFLPLYAINKGNRIRSFLATCGFETDYFKTSREYASGADYERRTDLGNVRAGDGKRFRGRSIIQTTGRYNYWRVVCRFVKKLTGKDFTLDERKYDNFSEYLKSKDYDALLKEADRLNVNFLAYPERLEEPYIAVEAACIFWEENNLNSFADRKQFKQLNGIVNKGDKNKTALGWTDREKLYKKCCSVVPEDFSLKINSANRVIETKPAETEISKETNSDFLKNASDRYLSPEQVKTVSLSLSARLWRFLVRPLGLLYAALEAGNIAAWLGVIVAAIATGYLIYSHRETLRNVFQIFKTKLSQ